MWTRIRLISATTTTAVMVAILCNGCTAQRSAAVAQPRNQPPSSPAATNQITVGPATQPADDKANLTLDQIQPAPSLPTTAAPTTASTKPPLEALELYARARDALAGGHQFTAISALERAIKIDPDSAELYRLLSRGYMAGGNSAKALEALERATQIDPQHLRSQTALARLYLQRGKTPEAIDHLRIGLLTRQYAEDEGAAGIADYFLAKALQQQGYDRAAVEQFEILLDRLSRRTLALRSDAELSDWAARPQSIYADVARLYERRHDYQKALDAWRQVAAFDDDDLETRSRIVEMLLTLGRPDEALREAAAAVRQAGATSQSLQLLRDVARRVGKEEAVYDELRRLQQERPDDRSLLYARVDLLASNGREAEAQATLEQAARVRFDSEIVHRLIRFYSDRAQTTAAAKLLIEAATAKPDEVPIYVDSFGDLLYPLRSDSLRAADVQRIEVAPAAEPAKNYFLALAANNREILIRESLDRATQLEPLFAPAYRLAIRRLGNRNDLDSAARERAAQALIARAERSGQPGLAEQLRAYQLNASGALPSAIAAFEEAARIKPLPPEPAMAYAQLCREQGNAAKFEQTLWRLISEYPTLQPAYMMLINHHVSTTNKNAAAAINVIQRWRAGDPSNAMARIYEAQAQPPREATPALLALIRENLFDPDIVNSACGMLQRINPQALEALLKEQFERNSKNAVLAGRLIDVYRGSNRAPEAQAVADRAREAATGDARQLYLVAQLYNIVQQKDKAFSVMEESLHLAPNDPATNNDLGYTWADEGLNLERAEALTRRAVEAEPDNGTYLDSLGWVLYKRGKFADARQQLERAIAMISTDGDAVVLDHLGDTLYRLNDVVGAQAQWNKAMQRLVLGNSSSVDIDALRPVLQTKIEQAQRGEPVKVAPISTESKPTSPFQAKN